MLVVEDLRRQITVAAVVTVEESPFLTTVQRIVCDVQVQPDLLRRSGIRLQETHPTATRSIAARSTEKRLDLDTAPSAVSRSKRFSVLAPASG